MGVLRAGAPQVVDAQAAAARADGRDVAVAAVDDGALVEDAESFGDLAPLVSDEQASLAVPALEVRDDGGDRESDAQLAIAGHAVTPVPATTREGRAAVALAFIPGAHGCAHNPCTAAARLLPSRAVAAAP